MWKEDCQSSDLFVKWMDGGLRKFLIRLYTYNIISTALLHHTWLNACRVPKFLLSTYPIIRQVEAVSKRESTLEVESSVERTGEKIITLAGLLSLVFRGKSSKLNMRKSLVHCYLSLVAKEHEKIS